ncbi:MAG: hypothetical protein PVJ28_04820 [Acidimicrobiia bacterium]|jgi:hypothetical protein
MATNLQVHDSNTMTSPLAYPGNDTQDLAGTDDDHLMTINFRSKRRTTSECPHETSMRIEVAGMSREVCESCGRVSVGFVEEHFSSEGAQAVESKASSVDSED